MTLKLLAPVGAEIAANEMPEPSGVTYGPSHTDPAAQLARANRYAISLLSGLRDIMLDEMLFAGTQFLERTVSETAIFNEFLAKLAEAHSIQGYSAMCQTCTKHQLDFIRRDMERVLKHSERTIDNAAKLAEVWRTNEAFPTPEQVRRRSSDIL